MSTLTVTSKGQVTLRKDVLDHLGVQPGQRISVDKLPDGRVVVSAEHASEPISAVFNLLKRDNRPALSIDDMNDRGCKRVGRQAMKITADTNVLVRAMIGDDEQQSALAQAELAAAELVAIALPSLCELVWVLSQGYKVASDEIADAVRRLTNAANVVVNRPAVEAGLALLDAGGDFADGVIAYEGRWLGGETFVSFDKKAVKRLTAQNKAARLLV